MRVKGLQHLLHTAHPILYCWRYSKTGPDMTNANLRRLGLSCQHDSKMQDGWGDKWSRDRRLRAPQGKTELVVCLLFPALESLRFDPAVKAMRMEFNRSSPQYNCFWSGSSLISQLAQEKIDWSSRRVVRDRLIIVWRLLHLYRSCDLSELLRVWTQGSEGEKFVAAKRKGWREHPWERVMVLPDSPRVCPQTLLSRYILLTAEWVKDLPSPAPVLVSLVRPYKALSPSRIAALTKLILMRHNINTSVFKPHSSRGAGLRIHKELNLLEPVSCEIGNWANQEAFGKHYKRLGAVDTAAKAIQDNLVVHNSPEPPCAGKEPSITPLNEHAGGRSEGEGTAQGGSGPAQPKPRRAKLPLLKGWRVSPRTHPQVHQSLKRPASAPIRVTRTKKGRACTALDLDAMEV